MRVMIVGAGVAGLTLGHELLEAGHDVTLIEVLSEVGGLARSFRYGDYAFDLGPHRFHTENPRVESFIKKTLGENQLEISRKSAVWLARKAQSSTTMCGKARRWFWPMISPVVTVRTRSLNGI